MRSRRVGSIAKLWIAGLSIVWPGAILASGVFAQTESHSKRATPDLSGIWQTHQDTITFSPGEPPMQSWAEAKFKAAKPTYGPHATPDSTDPLLKCLPPGVPRILLMPFPMQIVQMPAR